MIQHEMLLFLKHIQKFAFSGVERNKGHSVRLLLVFKVIMTLCTALFTLQGTAPPHLSPELYNHTSSLIVFIPMLLRRKLRLTNINSHLLRTYNMLV